MLCLVPYIQYLLNPPSSPMRWAQRSKFLSVPQLILSVCQAFHVPITYSVFNNHLLSVTRQVSSGRQRRERISGKSWGQQKPKARTSFVFQKCLEQWYQQPVPKRDKTEPQPQEEGHLMVSLPKS